MRAIKESALNQRKLSSPVLLWYCDSNSNDEAEDSNDPEANGSEQIQERKTTNGAELHSSESFDEKKPDCTRFLEVEDCSNSEWLMKASVTANGSDYMFLKKTYG